MPPVNARPTARLYLEVDMPSREVLASFLKAVRAWERDHPDVQFGVKVIDTDLPLRTAEQIFNEMEPPMPFKARCFF